MAGLYVHVPFCTQRCVYCDFYFTTTRIAEGPFVEGVEREAARWGHEFRDKAPLRTLYLGGGTPSLLSPDALGRIVQAAHDHFDTSGLEEVTVEANPEDLATAEGDAFLRGLQGLGVTRLSLGVQSFYADDLRFMNRAHGAEQADEAVRLVADAGFESFSVDLIFGLPEQPFEIWGANLEKATRLGAPHLSCYALTVEPRTPLQNQVARGLVIPPGDDELRERFLFTHQYVEERGLKHYEVSSFARPGAHSRHNSLYWAQANVLGLGPGAHSFWAQTRSRATRWQNVAHLGRWQGLLKTGHRPLDGQEPLGLDELADEAILLGLRRLDTGLDLDRLLDRFGVDLLAEKPALLAELERSGLLEVHAAALRLTPEGAALADQIAVRLAA